MATLQHQQTDHLEEPVPGAENMTFGIVVSKWNNAITDELLSGALKTLKLHGAQSKNIIVRKVPGSFELIHAATKMQECCDLDAIITLGCVVQGETPHFDYVCQGVTQGIASLNANGLAPVIFGLLTTLDQQQAEDRAGGKLGNKGEECAITAIEMVAFDRSLTENID